MLFKFTQQPRGLNRFSRYFLNSIQFLSTGSVVFEGRIENNVDNFSQDRVLIEFIKLPKYTK